MLGYYGNENWKMAVIRNGDKIYLQLPDVPKFEMVPISENRLVLENKHLEGLFYKIF